MRLVAGRVAVLPVLAILAALLVGCGGVGAMSLESHDSRGRPGGQGGSSKVVPAIEGELTIFAASSLAEAFQEIGADIEAANPDASVTYNFAGSSQLRTQLVHGAQADVFAAADEPNMDAVQQRGLLAGEPEIFARNRLVVIVPAANPAGIHTLQDLARPGIKLVLAQPAVPVGNYARQSLTKLSSAPAYGPDYAEQVLGNLVSEETNVKGVVAKVQLGEADAGIVYASDVTAAVRDVVTVIDIPEGFNVVARYPVAAIKGAPNAAAAQAFIDHLRSPAGQRVLEEHGFIPVDVVSEAEGG